MDKESKINASTSNESDIRNTSHSNTDDPIQKIILKSNNESSIYTVVKTSYKTSAVKSPIMDKDTKTASTIIGSDLRNTSHSNTDDDSIQKISLESSTNNLLLKSKSSPGFNQSTTSSICSHNKVGSLHTPFPYFDLNKWAIYFVMVIFGIYISYYTVEKFAKPEQNATVQQQKYCMDLINLAKKYPDQHKDTWTHLQSGIESIFNREPTKPSVFMLVHSDKQDISNLLAQIVDVTYLCFDTTAKSAPLNISYEDLNLPEFQKDYGNVIAKYRKEFESSGIMVVTNFNMVSPKVVPAFHTFCDIETPMVKKSVVFLTMPISLTGNESKQNINSLTETSLINLWKNDLEDHIWEPLLVRVTDQILLLK